MSLAFALFAAINGSTGSCDTLSSRALTTAPSLGGVTPAADGSHSSWATAQAVPDAAAQTTRLYEFSNGRFR
jgi:hypothetical protein